jgi:hypothetical protein
LFCQSYFDGDTAEEDSIRALADSLYLRADWQWASVRAPLIGHGWNPESGFLPYDWGGYNEAMILYLLALGSPTHPVAPEAWTAWTAGYRWGSFHDQEHLGFAPLFGHQYTHTWVDFRGIRDAAMREHNLDYFENARRAALAQHAYAVANPDGWTGYGTHLWGLTACAGRGACASPRRVAAGRPRARVLRRIGIRGRRGRDEDGVAVSFQPRRARAHAIRLL